MNHGRASVTCMLRVQSHANKSAHPTGFICIRSCDNHILFRESSPLPFLFPCLSPYSLRCHFPYIVGFFGQAKIYSLLTHIDLCHRTSIQRSCRLGNGFLTIVVDRFRGFKAKRTDLKSSETRGQNPSKPLNIHPRHNSPIIMTSYFPPRWTHDRKVRGSNPTCATIWAFLVRFQSSFSRSSSSFNKY